MAFILEGRAGALDLGTVGGLGWIVGVEAHGKLEALCAPTDLRQLHNEGAQIFWCSDEFNTQISLTERGVLSSVLG